MPIIVEKILEFFSGPEKKPREPIRGWADKCLGPCRNPPTRANVMAAINRYFPDRKVRDVHVEKRFFPVGEGTKKTYLCYLKVEIRFEAATPAEVEVGAEESPFR